eukprot:CAMPEP_0204120810 /NCGR_PEP_ID=MMETSP0361-20130328/7855_1 /ASSEMBLY_ACC=CAM_ASM_000343 /TAXON_ID=268821 /ORGANISM="Scrippsiella Hangoei, Strain SHTV-5" /LENGTH=474 /DNA_ID=CAMNT_0051072051 /DNA_START=47 /DNA_END=1471 /DNA_ORIENTATION=-
MAAATSAGPLAEVEEECARHAAAPEHIRELAPADATDPAQEAEDVEIGVSATKLRATELCATVIGFATMVITGSTFMICGVLYSQLLSTFGASRAKTSLVGSLLEFTYSGGGLPVPYLISRYGIVPMYLVGALIYIMGLFGDSFAGSLDVWIFTHGIVTALGMAILFMCNLEVLYTYTPREGRGLIVGISWAGGGIGTAVFSPILSSTSEASGLSATMRIAAAGSSVYLACVFALVVLLRRHGHPFKDLAKASSRSVTSTNSSASGCRSLLHQMCAQNMQWCTNTNFLILFAALFIYLFGFSVPLTHLPRLVQDQGVDAIDASSLMSIFGVLNAFGRVLFAYLGECLGGSYLRVFAGTVLANGVAILVLPFCRSFASFAAFAASCGLVAGGRAGLLSLVCCQLFGQQLASRAYALLSVAFMLSQTFGSPTVALIYDESGSYDAGFFLVGALMLTASLLFVLLDLRRARAERAAD